MRLAGIRQIAPRLVVIARGDRGERQPRNAGFEPPRHFEPDRAESGQSHLESFPLPIGLLRGLPRSGRAARGPDTVSMRRPVPSSGRIRPPDPTACRRYPS